MDPGSSPDLSRLAFVDVETTGFSPALDRITEIGVITLDGDGTLQEWDSLLNPRRPNWEETRFAAELGRDALAEAPRFADIAAALRERLRGRTFVAHNARFDYSFVQAEFERAGIAFEAPVLCSLRLSRRLYPEQRSHDLDALARRHHLQDCGARHRALPDARLLRQFWEALHAEHAPAQLAAAIAALAQEPLLPAGLDATLLERLPERPGVYLLHAADGKVLRAAKAANLRLHLRNYFRVDKASGKAQAIAHLVSNITWRETRGLLGAQLQLNAFTVGLDRSARGSADAGYFRLELDPSRYPAARVTALACEDFGAGAVYGPFDSERKARNALQRIACDRRICHAVMGLPTGASCTACGGADCTGMGRMQRLQHLATAASAFSEWRLPPWEYRGAIGIRERSDLHIIDRWCYLGTARNESETANVLQAARRRFDRRTCELLIKLLRRVPKGRIMHLDRSTEPLGEY